MEKQWVFCSWPDSQKRIELQGMTFSFIVYLFYHITVCYCNGVKAIVNLKLFFNTSILDKTNYYKSIPRTHCWNISGCTQPVLF